MDYKNLKMEAKKNIYMTLEYRNLDYSDLVLLNRIALDLKLKKYDEILDLIIDTKCSHLLFKKLDFYDKKYNS